jgi:predicted nucleic acid-binding Zn ribbon protein
MADDEPDYFCEKCGDKLRRIYDATPVKFNGTGFYSTGG